VVIGQDVLDARDIPNIEKETFGTEYLIDSRRCRVPRDGPDPISVFGDWIFRLERDRVKESVPFFYREISGDEIASGSQNLLELRFGQLNQHDRMPQLGHHVEF
jgi:hypothetical protein